MILSVLQQKPRYSYDPQRETPALSFLREMAARTLDDTFEMLGEAARRGSGLTVTIEGVNAHMALTDLRRPFAEVYEGLDGAVVERFSNCAKRTGMHIVAGLYLTIDAKTYNCAVLFDNKGQIAGIHRKLHLPAGEELQIAPGDRYDVFGTEFGPIGMLVCWDLQFPEAARALALKGANLIACPTWGWENLYGLCRAYENSVTIAAAMGVNASGFTSPDCDPSCVVDNMGRIAAAAPRDASAVVTCEVDIAREPAPQYGSERYIDSASMRKTRLLQRRPETYDFLTIPTAETPCYRRYFPDEKGDT
jgi:predicted amidohydrolase